MADKAILPIEQELQGERAAALGEAGQRLERALAALAAAGAGAGATDDEELAEAATAAWYLMIVRESLRMYDHHEVFAFYGVPPRVLARVGVVRR